MIIVKIYGGLGNQLFQYALGRCIAEFNNCPLYLDINQFEKNQLRGFELNKFNISQQVVDKKINRKYSPFESVRLNKIYNTLFSNDAYISEESFAFEEQLLEKKIVSCYLDGYWQHYKYFQPIENILRDEFILKGSLQSDAKSFEGIIAKTINSVSIHIRKTDFLKKENQKIFNNLGFSYYDDAIAIMLQKIQNPHFFVFSDDFVWVRDNLKLDCPYTYIDTNNKPHEDLFLMSLCEHNIIANSTFSWWGAWLNCNKNKVVVGPRNWFVNGRTIEPFEVKTWLFI